MSVSVRYGYDDHIVVGGVDVVWIEDDGMIAAPLGLIGDASLPRLRQTLMVHADVWGLSKVVVFLSEDPAEHFEYELSPRLPYRIVLRDGELLLEIDVFSQRGSPDRRLIRAGLKPVLGLHRAELLSLAVAPVNRGHLARLLVAWPVSRRTVNDAAALGSEIANVCDALVAGRLTLPATRGILEGGVWAGFIGQYECPWLEAKSQHYRRDERGRVALAGDIAAFCNADGGLLVVGMKTKKDRRGDRVIAVNTCALDAGTLSWYEQAIGRLIYPRPDGIRLQRLGVAQRSRNGLLVIDIPEQDKGAKPFMVARAVVEGRVFGTLVGIPTRTRDATEWLQPAELHARVRAGIALLRGD
jgi:hypothetical protein